MDEVDLNLLGALDALLTEGSVTGAARRLGLSTSAMSRTLTRLRSATGDPLLVRAGRRLVPTPRAMDIRDHVQALARDVRTVLSQHTDPIKIEEVERTFTIRANEGFVERFAASLVTAIMSAAPRVRLRFAPKSEKDPAPLRDGQVDLEIGVLGAFAPEIRARLIFRDRFVGAARRGHALLRSSITPERYASCKHVVASRKGSFAGPVDEALEELGLARETVAVVPSFSDALRIARETDLIALVPNSCLGGGDLPTSDLSVFELPVRTPEIAISAMWHPRMDADPAHRWLRETVIATCRQASSLERPAP